MKKELLVINTLVFLKQLKEGVPQSEMLGVIHQLGVKKAEVRREYIKNFDLELIDIKTKASDLDIEVFYSIPELLYINGTIQYENVETYFKEAFTMGCSNVKMIIGGFTTVTSEDVSKVNKLCNQYNIKMTVENDQTEENGKTAKIKTFIEMFRQLGGNISVTFDIGNWVWQNQDPIESARQLKEYVSYIHLKDILKKEKPEAVLLNEGDIPWENILDILPQDVPLALEYPCGTNAEKQLVTELEKLLNSNSFNK